jgi:hypothetical protein
VLLSHSHKFIFIKTVKTAGTSVEALLEPLCTPPGHVVDHRNPGIVSAYGVVGARGRGIDRTAHPYQAHMPAEAIRNAFPEEFAAYVKIANVRNPYDKAISHFHMVSGLDVEQAAELARSDLKTLQRKFHEHIVGGLPHDKPKLLIDDRLVVDRIIRFESLLADLDRLNADLKLGLSDIPASLPTFKMTERAAKGPPVQAYLSPESVTYINQRMAWYFDLFGYEMLATDDAGGQLGHGA